MPSRCLATRYASLRVPQCSVFSILPPFSAQVCSMPERTFLISSSGVAGRMMKIKSYKRSSMVTSFVQFRACPPSKESGYNTKPGNSSPLKRRYKLNARFVVNRLAAVVFRHSRIDSLRQNHLHRIARLANHFGSELELG